VAGPVGPARRSSRFDFIAGVRPVAVADGSDSVWWRVSAANNRALGRSAVAFGTLADCRDHARSIQSRIDDLVPALASNGRGQWTWSASLDKAPAARSARPFARRIDCIRTLALFLDAARGADVDGADLRRLAARATSRSAEPGSR
jgi:hypothetical protein